MPSALAFEPTSHMHGLRNRIGENNCFLNVTIQALWHLGPFREQLKMLLSSLASEGALLRDSQDMSILAALCNLFVQYEFADEEVLPATELRESLGKLSDKFQLGSIADANEALDAILQRIHLELRGVCPETMKCLSHATFGGMVLEQVICRNCSASSEPTVRNNFLMYFQAMELISEGRVADPPLELINLSNVSTQQHQQQAATASSRFSSSGATAASTIVTLRKAIRFGKLLRRCMMSVGERRCPSIESSPPASGHACPGQASMHFFSLEPPLALALSLSWDVSRQSVDNLHTLYSLVAERVYLHDIFSDDMLNTQAFDLPPNRNAFSTGCGEEEIGFDGPPQRGGPSYAFRGMICYYGNHYVSVFQVLKPSVITSAAGESTTTPPPGTFYLFDDQNVRPIGTWTDVVKLCLASIYQPVLLLYELERSSARMVGGSLAQQCSPEVIKDVFAQQWAVKPAPMAKEEPAPRPAVLVMHNAPVASSAPAARPVAAADHLNHSRRRPSHAEETMESEHDAPRRHDTGSHVQVAEEKDREPRIPTLLAAKEYVRFDKRGVAHKMNTSQAALSRPLSQTAKPVEAVTMSSTDKFKAPPTLFDRPFDPLDEEVDTIRKKWNLSSLRPAQSSALVEEPDLLALPRQPSHLRLLAGSEAPEKFLDFSVHYPHHIAADPMAVPDRNPFRSLHDPNAQDAKSKEADVTQYRPIITHWARKFSHYSVNLPVLTDPLTGRRTVGLGVAIDEASADRYPMVTNLSEDPVTGAILLPSHVTQRLHLLDHIIQVNNIDVHGMPYSELLQSVAALADSSELITFHFQSHRPSLCFYCRVCKQASTVDRAVEATLAVATSGGTKMLMRPVRIPCQHCGMEGLAMDYMP